MERQAEPLAPDGTAGRTVKCPKCGTGISMPEARARVTGTPPAQLDRSDKQSPAGAGPPDYPAMKREAAVVTLRQGARKVCDSARFGPSTAGRLCFALLLGAVLFGGALVLSFALGIRAGVAVTQGCLIFGVVLAIYSFLILGPSDNWLALRQTQLNQTPISARGKLFTFLVFASWRRNQR